jgi:Rrf2 family protein
MRLTTYTDYTLRVLIRLAVRPRDLTTIAAIPDSYGISENHLTKVVHKLGVAGYIETVRGRNGGIRLLKRPGDINVGEIVRRVGRTLTWCRASQSPVPAQSNLPAFSRAPWPMRAMRSSPRSNATPSPISSRRGGNSPRSLTHSRGRYEPDA